MAMQRSSFSLARAASVRELLLALLVALLAVPGTSEVEPVWPPKMPKAADCPECAVGAWTCPYMCNAAHIGRFFDFAPASGICWQQSVVDDYTMAVEVDFRCHTQDYMRTCDNMESLAYLDTSFMKGCRATVAGSDALFKETCSWTCKGGRPVQRCEWALDPEGVLRDSYGEVEACWVMPRCLGTHKVEITAMCQPETTWKHTNSTAAEFATVRDYFNKALTSGRRAEQRLATALQELSATKAKVEAAEAQLDVVQGRENHTLVDELLNATAEVRQQLDFALGNNTAQEEAVGGAQTSYLSSIAALKAVSQRLDASLRRLRRGGEGVQALAQALASNRAASQQLAALLRSLEQAARGLPQGGALRNATEGALDAAEASYEATLLTIKSLADQLDEERAAAAAAPKPSSLRKPARGSGPAELAAEASVLVLSAVAAGAAAAVVVLLRKRQQRRLHARQAAVCADKGAVVTGQPSVPGAPGVVVGHPVLSHLDVGAEVAENPAVAVVQDACSPVHIIIEDIAAASSCDVVASYAAQSPP